MVSQAGYSGRRYSRAYPQYMTPSERRYHISSHDGRSIAMAESQVETDSQPQRKRIAVACGRCRKRKIRCSGDPGGGQPCSNCKNAGSEPCLFLRVQSTEAPMRQDSSEFTYNVQDARAYANRTASHSVQYTQDLPALSSAEILNPYRGGSPYGYGTKQFYPAMSSYGTGYPEEYVEYGISCPSQQTVLNHEAVGMIPYPWLSRSKQPAASSVYLDPDATYAYGGTASLVHRSAHAVTTDSPNFSFSHMAAQLPAASVHGTDRLLPTPVSRSLSSSSGLPYPSLQSLKAAIPTTGPQSPPLSATGGPGDVASAAAAGYSNGFDTSGLPYSSAMAMPTHHHHHTPHNHSQHNHHPARTGSVPSSSYSTAAESLFSEHDHGLRSHGSTVVDLTGYAYADSGVGPGASSLRRGSRSSSQTSSGTGTGSSLRSSQTGYVQTENQQQQQQPDEPVAAHVYPHQHQQHQNGLQQHHQIQQPQQQQQQQQQHSNQQQQHHHHHHHHNIAAVVAGSTAPTATYLPDTPGASGLGSGHAENRRTAVGARR